MIFAVIGLKRAVKIYIFHLIRDLPLKGYT